MAIAGRHWVRGQGCKPTGWYAECSGRSFRPGDADPRARGRTAVSDHARALPDRPDLRFLKDEAKRRRAAGEFATLHDAQLAIAREHGLPSWTALKRRIEDSPALTQVRWLLARFSGADQEGWTAPDDAELRAHFDERFLTMVPPDHLVPTLSGAAARLREELVVTDRGPRTLRAHLTDLQVDAVVEPEPPHRLTRLRIYPPGRTVTDERVATPVTHSTGDVPAVAARLAEESVADLGLAGFAAAGATDGRTWALARGWADLDRGEELRPEHRFPAYSITKPVTATTVLRLVADGRIGLDDPANAHLRTVVLADDAVTVRELLSHTGGAGSPEELFADRVPELATLTGPVLECPGPRGTFAYSNGGYAVLGALVADVTGAPYADVVTDLVLRPLGMTASWFPVTPPDGDMATGYELGEDGRFTAAPRRVCTLPAAGGLWATASDLVRFGAGWADLLPGDLAAEAVSRQAARSGGAEMGFGWLLHAPLRMYGHAGGGVGASTSLIVRRETGTVTVALTNRLVQLEPVNARLG